jgi:glycosyltransferase involved in cell wall biosynthesis
MNDWNDFLRLFAGENSSQRHFTLLRQRGRFILHLPLNRKMADATLRLYPAQSVFARTLTVFVRGLIRCGIQASGHRDSFPIDDATPFSQFLMRVVPGSTSVPNFGIFTNRIREQGRPYVLLLFDASGRPATVVKLGISEEARKSIRVEQRFFFPEPPNFPYLPEALAMYEGENAIAIAYQYVEGQPVRPLQHGKIESLMNAWIQEEAPTSLIDFSVWLRLATLLEDNPGLKPVIEVLLKSPIKTVLAHGDLAPWNIRALSSAPDAEWVALDWERGTKLGVPGWDWLNFVLQYSVWIRRDTPHITLTQIENLWEDPGFKSYANRTGIAPLLKEVTFIYLLYFLRYLNPRIKTGPIHALLKEFQTKHFPAVDLRTPPLKISVVTPSYKQLPWLKLCVASVADQEGVEVQHIIQDAQSGPELETWVRQQPKVELHVEADSGMYDAINRGFARATGDIVCWLNSDEQYLEGALGKVARFFETHPEIDVLFGDALLIENSGALLSYRRTILPEINHIQLSHLNILSCATFVRRSVLEHGYLLDTHWKTIADAAWIVALLKGGVPMAVLNEPLSVFTITDKNLGQTSLALTEAAQWKKEIPYFLRALGLGFVIKHRLGKLIQGAYWPRTVTARFYTLLSPSKRVLRQETHIGFKWPNKL